MRYSLRFTILFLILAAGCNKKASQGTNTYFTPETEGIVGYESFRPDSLVGTILHDVDRDGISDTISLFRPRFWPDPGDFHFINICTAPNRKFEYRDTSGWVSLRNLLDSSALPTLRKMNAVQSPDLISLELDSSSSTILLFSFQYASSPGVVTALRVTRDSITVAFSEEFAIEAIRDVDGDGYPDMIGCHYSEEWGSDSVRFQTYNPFRIISMRSFHTVSDDLVRQYNVEHYFGNPSDGSVEPYIVVCLKNQAPFIMNEDEAYSKYRH